MAEAAKSRDSRRRRRILEQGSDRLSFITGRIQTLPPTLPDSVSSSQTQPHPNTTLSTIADDSDSISQHPEPYTTIQTPPKLEVESEISTVPTPEHVQSQPLPPQHSEEPKFFIIPSDITRAINSSRCTRLCCSILVALLVLLSYPGYAFLGSEFLNAAVTFRPLYLVLVTNLTVVIARLFSGKDRGFDRRQSRNSSGDDGGQYAQLARTLEICLVAQNVADAVFMDCAVYAVVLVCALSLLPA